MKPISSPTNTELSQLETEVETATLNDINLLDLDCHRAIDELHRQCNSLDNSFAEAAERLEDSAKFSKDTLKTVQKRLGELNYLLAEENINDPAVLDSLKSRILEAMEQAETALHKLADTFHSSGDSSLPFITYSKLFRERLELVRIHLLHDADTISEGFSRIRSAMESSPPSEAKESHLTLHEYLETFGKDAGYFLNVFFQNPDVGCRPKSWDHD